jgi:hypothetical protein
MLLSDCLFLSLPFRLIARLAKKRIPFQDCECNNE